MAILKTVEKAIRVLYFVCERDNPMGLTEISRSIGQDKASTLRILSTLVSENLLKQDARTRFYYPGPGILRLSYYWRNDLRSVCQPHMRALLEQFDETVCLMEPRGMDRICIDVMEANRELRVVAELGRAQPIYSGASGRALLAYLPERELNDILDQCEFLPLTKQSVQDREEYMSDLAYVRKHGYIYTANQVTDAAAGISAPIIDSDGTIVAAVVVRGPSARMTEDKSKEIGKAAVHAAELIADDLSGGRARQLVTHGRAATQSTSIRNSS